MGYFVWVLCNDGLLEGCFNGIYMVGLWVGALFFVYKVLVLQGIYRAYHKGY